MKNLKNIILISSVVILLSLWLYTGNFLFLLIEILFTDIVTIINIKKEVNIKLHIIASILLFTLTISLNFIFDGKESLIAMFLFLTHSIYLFYKEFKST